jgi:dTDP-4-amino-4,6-dideoxygalactose transaminase
MQMLLDRGIATRRGIMCAHRERAYSSEMWIKGSDLAQSEAAQDHCILLPLYHTITDEAQDFIATELLSAVEGAYAI